MPRVWSGAVSCLVFTILALEASGSAAARAGVPAEQHGAVRAAEQPLLDQVAVQEARKRFDDSLVDYPSTRFRNVVLVGADGERAFCGQLNTKNRAGGYGGWTGFRLGVGKNEKADGEGRLVLAGTPTAVDKLLMTLGGHDDGGSRDSSRRVIEAECATTEQPETLSDYSVSLTYGDAK